MRGVLRSVTPVALLWPLCAFGAILALPSPVLAQASDTTSAVSLERIRAGLQRPASHVQWQAPAETTPTFRIEVRQPLFVVPPLVEEKPFDPTFGLPSLGELFMGGIEKIRTTAVQYKRGRAERRARKKVDDDLAAFCAASKCTPQPVTEPSDSKPH
jgi:hypothetical protein